MSSQSYCQLVGEPAKINTYQGTSQNDMCIINNLRNMTCNNISTQNVPLILQNECVKKRDKDIVIDSDSKSGMFPTVPTVLYYWYCALLVVWECDMKMGRKVTKKQKEMGVQDLQKDFPTILLRARSAVGNLLNMMCKPLKLSNSFAIGQLQVRKKESSLSDYDSDRCSIISSSTQSLTSSQSTSSLSTDRAESESVDAGSSEDSHLLDWLIETVFLQLKRAKPLQKGVRKGYISSSSDSSAQTVSPSDTDAAANLFAPLSESTSPQSNSSLSADRVQSESVDAGYIPSDDSIEEVECRKVVCVLKRKRVKPNIYTSLSKHAVYSSDTDSAASHLVPLSESLSAEDMNQGRARTLGELTLKKPCGQIEEPLSILINHKQITTTIESQSYPSLLTMPGDIITLPAGPHTFCVVGDPNIPPFHLNGEVWHLGKLPYAKREAQWVAHVLKTTPIVEEQATKSTVLMRLMNAKVIHIATHGSSSRGFLAFGSIAPHGASADSKGVDAGSVLLYPEEVEKLSISPALVVLSSCDSGRGTVKADGIQGMARAFILAGAQSVLTTLWRVPDESASVFMKFFYQYLVDGLQSSLALHKAILSLRCFSKYSQYIHWSGYQLTGRDIRLEVSLTPTDRVLQDRLGPKSAFPRLETVKKLEDAFVNTPCLPTDVQVLRGLPGIRPSEIVKDFIHSSHEHFSGGIFWINCRQPDLIDASVGYIEKVIGTDIDQLPVSETQQALFVFDAITELPSSEKLQKLMRNKHVHIVFCSKSYELPDKLVKDVDRTLVRGCSVHQIEPLSMIDSTQRIVYSVMKDHHLPPNNEDQQVFENLADFTSGSPVIVEVTSKSLLAHFRENQVDTGDEAMSDSSGGEKANKILAEFSNNISLQVDRKSRLTTPQLACKEAVRCISQQVRLDIPTVCEQSQGQSDVWDTNSQYDSWDSIEELINSCNLSAEEKFLLNTLCMFSCSPIPYSLVIELSSLIATASQQPHIAGTLSDKLLEVSLMKKYPSPVVLHPSLTKSEHKTEPEFVYVPQFISRSIWKNIEEIDRVVAFSTMYQALLALHQVAKSLDASFFSGLCFLLLEMFEFEFPLMGKDCYKAVYSLYLDYKFRNVQSSEITAVAADEVSYKPHNREMNADRRLSYKPKLRLMDNDNNGQAHTHTLGYCDSTVQLVSESNQKCKALIGSEVAESDENAHVSLCNSLYFEPENNFCTRKGPQVPTTGGVLTGEDCPPLKCRKIVRMRERAKPKRKRNGCTTHSCSIANENIRDEEVPITKEPAADHSDKTRLQTALTNPHSIKKHNPRKQFVTTHYPAHHSSLCELNAEYYLGQDAFNKPACTKDPMQLKENLIKSNELKVEVDLSDFNHYLICEANNNLSDHDTLSDGCSIISSSPLSLTSSRSTTSLSTDRAESVDAGYAASGEEDSGDASKSKQKRTKRKQWRRKRPRNGCTSFSLDSSALAVSSSDTDSLTSLSVPLSESVSSEDISQESKEAGDASNTDNQPHSAHTMSNMSETYSSSQKSMSLTLAVAKPVQSPIHVGVQLLPGVELPPATTIAPMYQHVYPHFRFTHVLQQIDFSPNVHQTSGSSCLHIAVQNRHIWPLEFLLKKFEMAELISRPNRSGFSPLCQAVMSEDHQATSVLLQELIRSQGICSISQAFPRDWIHDVTLPNLIHLYLCHPPSRWLAVAICKECGTEDSLPNLHIEGIDIPVCRGLVNNPPKSTKSKVPGFLSSTNKKVASKQTASTQWSSGASAQALPHRYPVEAVDNSYSVLHCDHQVQPLQAMKTLVATEEVSGCCMKHKIIKHFVTGVCQSSVLLKQLAEQHSDLATDNSASTNQHEGRGTSVVSPDSPLQHPNMQREHEEVCYNRHSDEPRSRNVDNRSRQDVQCSCRQPADVRRIESYQDVLATASQLLHVPDYEQMYVVLTTGFQNCPPDLPPQPILAFHFGCGLSEYKQGLLKEATASFNKLEAAARSVGRHGDVALANLYKGDIEFTQEAYLAAVANYNAAVENYSLPGSASIVESAAKDFHMVVPSLSVVNSKLGAAFRNASKPVDAIEWYKIAIENAKTHLSNTTETGITAAKKDELAAHTSLGNLYQSRNENAKALKEYEVAIELAEDLKDYISLGWAHGNMGNAYLGLHRKDEALFHLQKALDLAVEHGPTPQAIGRTYNNLGTAYQSINDLDQAEQNYDLALSQAIYGNDIPGQASEWAEHEMASLQHSNISQKPSSAGATAYVRKVQPPTIKTFDFAEKSQNNHHIRLPSNANSLKKKFKTSSKAYSHHVESNSRMSHSVTDYEKPELSITSPKPSMDISSVASDSTSTKTQNSQSAFYIHAPGSTNAVGEHRPPTVPDSIVKYYAAGSKDLEEVVKHHEENFENLKGSSKGLSLSVSLFESNSRTFHRLQDCLVMQGKYDRALLVADQSRARTLGELMLKKQRGRIEEPLSSPLDLEHITTIIESQSCPVMYLSYTGARLLGWVFVPHSGGVSMNMFEVPLEDDVFDGKSLDYHLRYNLTDKLVERSFEMFQSVIYDKESSGPVQDLHNLIAKPLLEILKRSPDCSSSPTLQKIVVVSDSYTDLLPFTCLLDSKSGDFLGDQYYFQKMPSLLSMGILSQMPGDTITLPASPRTFCVVGDPNIPPFNLKFNGEVWHLGKLPYARREAQWVAHVLKTTPIVEEQATKNAVLMRLMNAKLIHIATHGSASRGFLAFGSIAPHGVSADSKGVDAGSVLLYPEEVEKLSISPALVVLSSCDSGRGTVKADEIQGMARAFILAGAQSVLTTLWRAPDESASVFVKFFYQYLVDGLQSSLALHKAIHSLRCFTKYSQYIHWSGYQLTGRDIRLEVTLTPTDQLLEGRLGPKSAFPRLETVKKLEDAFVNTPCLPTDVQVLRGLPGIRPSEIVKDFIHSSHEHFSGGIFWINCRQPDLIDASVEYIENVIGTDIGQLPVSETQQALFVFDAIIELPSSDKLQKLMRNKHVHMVFCSKSYELPDKLVKDVDRMLIRGCSVHQLEPLSMIDSTQRIVYSVMKDNHLAPNNEDQQVFEKLAEFTSGSPVIVEVASKSLLAHFRENQVDTGDEAMSDSSGGEQANKILAKFSNAVSLQVDRKSQLTTPQLARKETVRCISQQVRLDIPTVCEQSQDQSDVWDTNSQYDSWDSIEELINSCNLSAEEKFLLNTLCIFSCSPIPHSLIIELSSLIATASQQPHIAGTLSSKLLEMCLMKKYPSPVVIHPSLTEAEHKTDPEFVYVPQFISRYIWKNIEEIDRVVALSTMYQALLTLHQVAKPLDDSFFSGLCLLLLEMYEFDFQLMGADCFKAVFSLYFDWKKKASLKSSASGMYKNNHTFGYRDSAVQLASESNQKCEVLIGSEVAQSDGNAYVSLCNSLYFEPENHNFWSRKGPQVPTRDRPQPHTTKRLQRPSRIALCHRRTKKLHKPFSRKRSQPLIRKKLQHPPRKKYPTRKKLIKKKFQCKTKAPLTLVDPKSNCNDNSLSGDSSPISSHSCVTSSPSESSLYTCTSTGEESHRVSLKRRCTFRRFSKRRRVTPKKKKNRRKTRCTSFSSSDSGSTAGPCDLPVSHSVPQPSEHMNGGTKDGSSNHNSAHSKTTAKRSEFTMCTPSSQSTAPSEPTQSTASSRPTLKNLTILKWRDDKRQVQRCRVIRSIKNEWYRVGAALGLIHADLRSISTYRRDHPEECCNDVLEKWMEEGSPDYPFTWDGVLELLEDVEFSEVANELRYALPRQV